MENPNRAPRSATDVATALELAVAALVEIDSAPDRMHQFRKAMLLVDAVIHRVGITSPSDLPEEFGDLAGRARHCLNMGKPRECLFMFRRLQRDLIEFRRTRR